MKLNLSHILLGFILLSHSLLALSFTLTSANRGFEDNKIDIYIAGNDCSNAGFTTSEYKTMIEDAVKFYWNDVSTSSLEISVKDIDASIDITNDTHESGLSKVPANSILAGCNGLVANGFNDGSILGSAVLRCSGSTCRAILILNAHANSYLKTYSTSRVEAVIAHEIGHALGLGHSEHRFNLMFYSIDGKNQEWLGLDDIQGISYLYPHEASADFLNIPLSGSCGTIDLDGEHNKPNFLGSALLGLGLFIMLYMMQFFTKPLIRFLRN